MGQPNSSLKKRKKNSRFLTLPSEIILDKTKYHPLEILQNGANPLGNSEAKSQDP